MTQINKPSTSALVHHSSEQPVDPSTALHFDMCNAFCSIISKCPLPPENVVGHRQQPSTRSSFLKVLAGKNKATPQTTTTTTTLQEHLQLASRRSFAKEIIIKLNQYYKSFCGKGKSTFFFFPEIFSPPRLFAFALSLEDSQTEVSGTSLSLHYHLLF